MKLDIEPVDATLGAFVHGVKLNALDDATFAAVHEAWLEHALLIFPGQHLTRAEQIAFARRIGPLEYEMIPITNVKPDGTLYAGEKDREMVDLLLATHNWHADSTYQPIQAKGAVFCAEVIPAGGTQTGFADMRAAYDALEPTLRKRIDQLTGSHSFFQKQATQGHAISRDTAKEVLRMGGEHAKGLYQGAPPQRPLVKVHPETGRKSLLIGHHVCRIDGLADEEATDLLKDLLDFACQPPRTYHHNWTAGEAVLWDNRCLLHRSRPWNMSLPRVMWHTRLAGDPVTEAALN